MYAHLETVNSWVFLPLKREEIAAFKQNAATCLDSIRARKYEGCHYSPASLWFVRTAKLLVELPGPVEHRADTGGPVCRHGYGYGTHVLQREDGYSPHVISLEGSSPSYFKEN